MSTSAQWAVREPLVSAEGLQEALQNWIFQFTASRMVILCCRITKKHM